MFSQLDTLIGFVVVMALVSLLVTIITQAVSSFVGLRGKNLADALGTLFHKIDSSSNGDSRLRLINDLLTRPAISDSVLPMSKDKKSLWNWDVPVWRWFVLRWRRTAAIRSDELLGLLEDLAGVKPANAKEIADAVQQSLETAIAKSAGTNAGAAPVITDAVKQDLEAVMTKSAGIRAAATKTKVDAAKEEIEATMAKLITDAGTKIDRAKQALEAATLADTDKVEGDAVKKNLENAIAKLAKINPVDVKKEVGAVKKDLEVAISRLAKVKAAGVKETVESAKQDLEAAKKAYDENELRYTALRILSQLWNVSSERIRAFQALESALPKLAEQKGAAAIEDVTRAANHALDNLDKWFNSSLDRARQWFALHTRVITIIASILAAFVLQLDTIQLLKQISSDKELRNSLVKTAADSNLFNVATGVMTNGTTFEIETNEVLYHEKLAVLTNALNVVLETSSQDGLQLLPKPYPIQFDRWRYYLPWFKFNNWSWPPHRLLGIIISAGLLSLGAPFWFNMLKSLANLRSSLANQLDENPRQK